MTSCLDLQRLAERERREPLSLRTGRALQPSSPATSRRGVQACMVFTGANIFAVGIAKRLRMSLKATGVLVSLENHRDRHTELSMGSDDQIDA